MVTTSGGGFALMAEGVSLAGIIESPAVIHLAQRLVQETGLPTRTEQWRPHIWPSTLAMGIFHGSSTLRNLDDGIRLTTSRL